MAKLEIASIQNAQMQAIAKKVDTNNDGMLKKEEFCLFSQEATQAGIDYKTISETLGLNAFQRWINDVDKVCTDGKDDGKLGFGETMESFGKGLAGLVKGAINHPIATAATIGVGAVAVALTGGAILPVMIAAGATLGAGMIGVGAYNAATAETDAEAKKAWETIGTGTFTVGASVLGAKSALNQANKAGVASAQGAKDMSIGKAFVQNFKSIPEALKVSKGNAITNVTGALAPNAGLTTTDMKGYIDSKGNVLKQKVIPEGTKYFSKDGVVTVDSKSVLIADKSGNLSHISYQDLLNQYGITENQIKGIPSERVADIIFKNVNIENVLKIHSKSAHMDAEISGANLFRRELQGGTELYIKAGLLKEKGVRMVYGFNSYNGGDPLVGYMINNNLYELPSKGFSSQNKTLVDYIFSQIETQQFPTPVTEEVLINKFEVVSHLYTR